MAEERTSLAWIAVKNSLTTPRAGVWQISGASTMQKHWHEFAGELLDCFRLCESWPKDSAGWIWGFRISWTGPCATSEFWRRTNGVSLDAWLPVNGCLDETWNKGKPAQETTRLPVKGLESDELRLSCSSSVKECLSRPTRTLNPPRVNYGEGQILEMLSVPRG